MTAKFLKFPLAALVLAMAAAVLSGCRRAEPARVARLDLELQKGAVPTDTAMARAARLLFAASGYGELTDLATQAYAELPSIKIHREAVAGRFADIGPVADALGEVDAALKEELPQTGRHEYFAIISPFNQSVIVSDSTVFIGLNHYLGQQYEPYGYFPEYQRRRKEAGRIAPDVAEAIVRTSFPYSPSAEAGDNLLARMLYEGAVAVAVARVAHTSTDAAIGYTPDESRWLRDNSDQMWRLMAERKMLFSSDPSLVRNLLDLGPGSTRIAPDAPGAAGRFIGAAIVEAYAGSHPDAPLASLLELYKSPTALADSNY